MTATMHTLPTAAPQQSATINLQQALATGASAASLRAAADWNDRKSFDERRRKARSRHKAQADALRVVADQVEFDGQLGRVIASVARAA